MNAPALELPPCPACGAAVESIRTLFEHGRVIPTDMGYVKEDARVRGQILTPCGHVLDGWQWEMKPVVTYGNVIPNTEEDATL